VSRAGTLIKLVYTASCGDGDGAELRFAKFERRRLHECLDFVRAKGLLGCNGRRC
jgi:type II pantothenate kinase